MRQFQVAQEQISKFFGKTQQDTVVHLVIQAFQMTKLSRVHKMRKTKLLDHKNIWLKLLEINSLQNR